MRLLAVLTLMLMVAVQANAAETASDLPTLTQAQQVCGWYADQYNALTPAAARGLVLQHGYLDIRNNGEPHEFTTDKVGTMRVDWVQGDGAMNTGLIAGQFDADALRWLFGAGYLPFGDRVYQILFRNNLTYEYPAYLLYPTLAGNHVLCAFAFDTEVSALWPVVEGGATPAFCRADDGHSRTEVPVLPITDSRRRLPNTTMTGTVRVDFDNDGMEDELYAIHYSSGAGRGCSYRSFVTKACWDEAAERDGGNSRGFSCLEGNDQPSPRRFCNKTEARWFTAAGQTYLEISSPVPPWDEAQHNHIIAHNRNGTWQTICAANYKVRLSVSAYSELLK